MLRDGILPPIMENESPAYKLFNANISDSKLYMRFKSLVHTGAGANVADVMANGVGFSPIQRNGAGISHRLSTVLDA